jgi:hypothetical protein
MRFGLNINRAKKVAKRVMSFLKKEYGGDFDYNRVDLDGSWHSDFFYPFHIVEGLTKMTIILENEDFVLKIPFSRGYDNAKFIDHCKKEVEVYKDAEDEGLEGFFAECGYVGKFNGEKVYAMIRADVSEDDYDEMSCRNLSQEEISSLDSLEIFIENLKNYYGDVIAEAMEDFIDEECIDDFHGGNVGFIGNAFVCIDYSGVEYQID